LLVSASMLLRALGIGPNGSLFVKGTLKRGEPILVADFDVKGSADTSLSGTLAEAVRADLAQSSALRVLPATEVRDVLQRMQKPATSRLESALARDVAERSGVRAVVEGDLT